MRPMQGLAIGAIGGYLVGAGVWVVAGRLGARYEAELSAEGAGESPPTLRSQGGLVSSGALLLQAAFALLGGYVGWKAPGAAQGVGALVVTGLLAAISLIDWRVRRIPNILCAALVLWALVQIVWLGRPQPGAAAIGALAAGGLFLVVALIGRGAMGAGDIKLATALGAILGFPLIFPGLALGIIAGGLAALVLLLTRRVGRKGFIAYGPYLALGSWLVWMGAMGFWP